MFQSSKPVVCINGSRSINYLNLNMFIDPSHVGRVVSGGARGVDSLAAIWAKKNKIELVEFFPKWKKYGKKAGLKRNKDMVDFCDILISFWDGKSKGTLQTIRYAKRTGVPYICHLIQELD